MAKSFRINLSALDYNLKNFDDRARKAISASMEFQAASSERFMKTHAPWTDRTGAARAGLYTTVLRGGGQDSWELILAHTVAYGIWLEVANSGQYAIIRKTWHKANADLIRRLSGLFSRMEKGK